jgi:hypothetical protein
VEKTENKRTMQEEEEETETENEQQQLKEQFKDQGTTNATTKSEKKMGNCRVCEEQEGKYRCPKCLLISCSLQCVNVHKEKFNCDGKRDRFQFVNLKEMEDKHVTSDFRFLEEATEVLDRAKRKRISMMSTSGRSGVLIGNNNNNNNNRKRKRNNGNKKNKNNKNNNSFDKKNGDPEVKKLVVGIAPEAPAV